jgi:uncharacterized protein YdiU (UPF0061 family)
MKIALRDDQSPLDANLEKVLPGVHQWHRMNNQSIEELKRNIQELGTAKTDGMKSIADDAREERQLADRRMADAFRQLANLYDAEEDNGEKTIQIAEAIALPDSPDGAGFYSPDPSFETRVQDTTPRYDNTYEFEENIKLPMMAKHKDLIGVWNEWFGYDDFADEYDGVAGREKRFGLKWRKDVVNPQHFSRTKHIITAIQDAAKSNNMTELEVVASWEEDFATDRCSIAKFVNRLKESGWLKERAP